MYLARKDIIGINEPVFRRPNVGIRQCLFFVHGLIIVKHFVIIMLDKHI